MNCRVQPRLSKSIAFSDGTHIPPQPRAFVPLAGLRFLVSMLLLVVALSVQPQNNSQFSIFNSQLSEVLNFQFNDGDLLFVAQAEANAITEVTQGVDGLAIDHVAILHHIGGEQGPLYALEAIPRQGVVLTPIDSLLAREHAATFVMTRVEGVDAATSVRNALRYVGKPYDDLFLPGDSAIYCSELVQMCYVDAAGNQVFGTIPMSFHDASGRILDHWTEFYRSRGMTVPEGLPGTNPGQLSRHPKITIFFSQIKPEICTDQRE